MVQPDTQLNQQIAKTVRKHIFGNMIDIMKRQDRLKKTEVDDGPMKRTQKKRRVMNSWIAPLLRGMNVKTPKLLKKMNSALTCVEQNRRERGKKRELAESEPLHMFSTMSDVFEECG